MPLKPPGSLGVATAIGFQPTGGGKSAITRDFVLTGNEVNPVIQALRSNGIEMTALHSHMLNEQLRLFFMHFWAMTTRSSSPAAFALRSTGLRATGAKGNSPARRCLASMPRGRAGGGLLGRLSAS